MLLLHVSLRWKEVLRAAALVAEMRLVAFAPLLYVDADVPYQLHHQSPLPERPHRSGDQDRSSSADGDR